MPAAKRTSCSTQRTSISRGSRSIESDNSSFGEDKPSIYLDLPNSAWEEQRRRHSHNVSTRKDSSSKPQPDSPAQGDHHQKLRCSLKQTEDGLDISPSPLIDVREHSRNYDSLTVKQSETNKNKRSCNLTSVHTVTGIIPLFEQANPSKKNTTTDDATRRRSSFRFLTRKHAAIHDESTACEDHKFDSVAEYKIKEDNFFANEASYPRASQRPSRPRARSMKQLDVRGSSANSPTPELANQNCKESQRSAKRNQHRYQVQQQAQSFLETCKIDYL